MEETQLTGSEPKSKLIIKIKNVQPVELTDLAQSMLAMAAEYKTMLEASSDIGDPNEVKLYVKEVRSGSIIQELIPYALCALPFVDHYNTISSFALHLSKLKEWFTDNRTVPTKLDFPIERKSLQNLVELLAPVAKDPGSSMSIEALTVNGNMTVSVAVGWQEASAIQNNIAHALRNMKKSVAGDYRNVVMYWSQARNDKQAKSGDKAVIESISRAAIKVLFSSDDLKKRMLFDVAHPFEKAFIVDVWVETIDEKPVLYVVHECRDTLDRA